MSRFIFSFAVILSGLVSGFAFARLQERFPAKVEMRVPRRPGGAPRAAGPGYSTETIRIGLQRFALFVLNPIAFVGAVWSLRLADARFAALPVVGLATLVSGFLLGRAGARFLRLPPLRAGVFIPSSSFTNIGSIGGLLIFILVGEAGFALVPFYKLFEETWYFSVLFPTARRYGERIGAGARESDHPETASRQRISATLKRIATDPFIIISLSSVLAGLALNLSGARRPAFYADLNSVLIPLASWLTLFTIGMRMKIGNLFEHPRTTALFLGMRALLPVIGVSLGLLLGLGRTEGGIGLKTVLVLSSMPVGFLGVVPPAMFGLDVEFANRLWLVSNATLVLIVPLLTLLLKTMG